MNVPEYTPQEMVRLELLQYENPEGLHPVEQAWRDLARKLLRHAQSLEELVIHHHDLGLRYRQGDGECHACKSKGFQKFNFPQPFKPKV